MIPGTKTTGERSHRHLKNYTEDVDDESEKLRAELAAVEEAVEAQRPAALEAQQEHGLVLKT